jgi:hypothetical protein
VAIDENDIFIGLALSCVNNVDGDFSVPWFIPDRMHIQRRELSTPWFMQEWQPERLWADYKNGQFVGRNNRWWQTLTHNWRIRHELANQPHILGIHSPIQMIDVLDDSWNKFKCRQSIACICEAMEYANATGGDYFVYHLDTVDIWPVDHNVRRDRISKSLKIYARIMEYYQRRGFRFVPCIEVLEYPKYPASPFEIFQILKTCKIIMPRTQLVLDLAHLWRSRFLICKTESVEFNNIRFRSFTQELWDILGNLGPSDVYLFHLGGCFDTKTHEIPGIFPWQDAYNTVFRLDCPDELYYEEREMNVSRALDAVIEFCWRCCQPIRMILEIHGKDFDVMIKSLQEVNWALHNKVRRRWGM